MTTTSEGIPPLIARQLLSQYLRRLRSDSGLSQADFAREVGVSTGFVGMVENDGQRTPNEDYIRGALRLLNRSDEVDGYLSLVERARTRDEAVRGIDRSPYLVDFDKFIQFELVADAVRLYESRLVPGQLQTSDYVRAVQDGDSTDDMDRRVGARMQRQERFMRSTDAQITAVIERDALERPVAPPEVMREQMQHLVEMTNRPNVTIQIAPRGMHAAMTGSFTILDYESIPLPDVVVVETAKRTLFFRHQDEVDQYRWDLDQVRMLAMSEKDSREVIERIGEDQ